MACRDIICLHRATKIWAQLFRPFTKPVPSTFINNLINWWLLILTDTVKYMKLVCCFLWGVVFSFYWVTCACTRCTLGRLWLKSNKQDWLDESQGTLLAQGLLSKTSQRIISCALSLPISLLKATFMHTMPSPVKSGGRVITYCDFIAKINISFL